MSLYSGKCDMADVVEIHGIDNMLKSKIFIESNIVPLKIETEKDLVPYYPFLIASSGSENGIGSFRITDESYVDREERQILDYYTNECKDYIKKCKRNKQDVDIEHFKNEYQPDIYNQILSRLLDKSCEFNLYGIHTYMAEYYRIQLYNEMIRVGWTPSQALLWCFGWRKEYPKCEI